MKFLDELQTANLPKGKYVIFGSGPLAIRGIREYHDIDILVTSDLWDELSNQYSITKKQDRPDSIYHGNLQFLKIDYKDWGPQIPDNNIMIQEP